MFIQGLKVAPEGVSNGSMFGKGIYFADTFQKAINYSSEHKGYQFVFLCEVGVGKMKVLKESTEVKGLPNNKYQSVKGEGIHQPHP